MKKIIFTIHFKLINASTMWRYFQNKNLQLLKNVTKRTFYSGNLCLMKDGTKKYVRDLKKGDIIDSGAKIVCYKN